jgi:hypothetical protein
VGFAVIQIYLKLYALTFAEEDQRDAIKRVFFNNNTGIQSDYATPPVYLCRSHYTTLSFTAKISTVLRLYDNDAM